LGEGLANLVPTGSDLQLHMPSKNDPRVGEMVICAALEPVGAEGLQDEEIFGPRTELK